MTLKKKDAVLITEEIVAEIPLVVNVRKVVVLPTVPVMYQLNTFDTLHLRPGKDIVIDSKNYTIKAFTQNSTLTVMGKTAADTEPPTGDFTVYAPHYVHGSPIITANKQQAKKLRADRIPFIWLYEILEEDRNTDPDNPFGLSYSARIFFMDESKLNDFSPKHYVDIIRPMMQLAEEFVQVIADDNGKFNEVSEYKIIPHANFGTFTADKGHKKQYFGENLSGVELKIDIEVERDACINRGLLACNLSIVLTSVPTSAFGASDGTATATPIGGQGNITYLWSDGQTTQTAVGLSAGTISVTVMDDHLPEPECQAFGEVAVIDPAFIFKTKLAVAGTFDVTTTCLITWTDGVDTFTPALSGGKSTVTFPNWNDATEKTVRASCDDADLITGAGGVNWTNKDITELHFQDLINVTGSMTFHSNGLLILYKTFNSSKVFTGCQFGECVILTELDLTPNTGISNSMEFQSMPLLNILLNPPSSGAITKYNFTNADVEDWDASGLTFANNMELLASGNSRLKTCVFGNNSNDFKAIRLHSCDLGVINFEVLTGLFDANNTSVRLFDNNMTAAEVNENLVKIDSVTSAGGVGRSINIAGSNAAPDAISGGFDGSAAVISLIAKGLAVTTS